MNEPTQLSNVEDLPVYLEEDQLDAVAGGDGQDTGNLAIVDPGADDPTTADAKGKGGGNGQIYLSFKFKLVSVKTVSW